MSGSGRELTRLRGCLTFGNGKAPSLSDDGAFPVYGSNGVIGRSKAANQEGSIILGRVGAYCGSVYFEAGKYWATDNTIVVKVSKKNDARFFDYLLRAYPLRSLAGGSAQPLINQKILSRIEAWVPPLPTQRKIAAILTAYDDLIETNKRRLALLEKMAEELYREWFVRMRFPGHHKTKFVKGVPEGWESECIAELIEHYIGGGWGEENPTSKFSEPAFVIRGTDIPRVQAGQLSSIPFRYHTPSNLESRVMQPDDFVFEASGGSKDQLLGRNVRISSVFLDSLPHGIIPASFCKLIRFNKQKVSPYLMEQYLRLFYDQGLVGIYQVQSTGISNYQFESFIKYHKMLLPSVSLQRQFEENVKRMLDLKDRLGLENTVLTQTRNLLLPRLISGKLSVEDLDIQFPPSMQEEATQPQPAYA